MLNGRPAALGRAAKLRAHASWLHPPSAFLLCGQIPHHRRRKAGRRLRSCPAMPDRFPPPWSSSSPASACWPGSSSRLPPEPGDFDRCGQRNVPGSGGNARQVARSV